MFKFKLHDHWKSIAFVILTIAVIAAILLVVKFKVETDPGIVLAVKSFVQTHGLPAGVLIAIFGSVWFVPFPYDPLVVAIIKLYEPMFVAVLAIAGGATIADIVNFYSGRKFGEAFVLKYVKKETVVKIQKFLTKYGIATLIAFSFLGPVTSYDIVAFVVGGFSKMKFKIFLPVSFVCRIIHFSFGLLLAEFLLKLIGVTF